MSVSYANHWDAAKLLREMTNEQRARVSQGIVERKMLHRVLGRSYNEGLCTFVERRLEKEQSNDF